MLRNVLLRALLFTVVCAVFASHAVAVPLVLSHQGRLLDAGDAPISGTFTIVYSIYDAPVGGAQLWMEDHVGVVVSDGLFSVELGSTVPLTADIVAGSGGGGGGGGGGAIRFLQVQIAGEPPIMPRTALVSSPYSVATSRVSGDVQTAPGELKASAASDTKRIGIRVADSLAEASSIAIDEPGVQIALRITPDSTVYDQGDSSGARNMVHAIHRGEDRISQTITPTASSVAIKTKGTGADANKSASIMVSATPGGSASATSAVDLDGDDNPEGEISQLVTPTTSGVAIKTKGTGADANKTASLVVSATPGGSVSSVATVDLDGDDDPEGEISQSVTPTTSGVAIKVKGTGAEKNRTAGSSCDDSLAVHYLDIDDDGDGISEASAVSAVSSVSGGGGGGAAAAAYARWSADSDDDGIPEGDISQSVTPTTCGVAIKTKGTGADPNRVVSSQTGTTPFEVTQVMSIDDDGDTVPESEISQSVTPTTCGVAIKAKGTGADKDRVIGGTCDDSSAVVYLDLDDDGDGIAEGRGIISVKSASGTGATTAESRLTCDSDDDGNDDMSVVSSCDASQAKIVTDRDSGRSKARMGTTGTESSVAVEDDSDGDGVSEFSSQLSCDSSSARGQLTATAPGTSDVSSVTFEVDATGPAIRLTDGGFAFHLMTGDGVIMRSTSNVVVSDLDRDGNLFLASNLSVGAPGGTHHIDVAGGAYCDGTNWVNASDRNSKENFKKVNGEELLGKIADLEITQWNYKNDKSTAHIGPTAQDFKEKFGVGSDGKSISTIDPSGIALAAIKELYKQFSDEMKQKDAQIEQLQNEMKKLRKELQKKN